MSLRTKAFVLLAGLASCDAVSTCGDVKKVYKAQGCCGNPDQAIDLDMVTKEMVRQAQKAWGDGIVKIASAKEGNGDYTQVATDHINDLYAYDMGHVLFKPTLAAEMQFRDDFNGALSYFVATNSHAAEDKGFAIKGWTKVRFENDEILTSGNTAVAMGNYFFTNPDGDEVKVEYSFGYILDPKDDTLRINLHHSSMPYVPAATKEMVEKAQKAWGDGIVKIAKAKVDGLDYEQVATEHIETLYAYDHGHVLFKPTLAAAQQFRSSFEGALSYFVAGDTRAVSEDKGFAIKGWTNVTFENEEIITSGPTAVAMGNYCFTTPEGDEVKVEYSFGYVLIDGELRINLHHSSMPYVPGATRELVVEAQEAWGAGIVKIALAKMNGDDFEQVATDHINNLYGYGTGPVLFKPTLAAAQQFRGEFDGALSYFVATNGVAPEDKGFAIKNWTKVRFENEEIIVSGDTAMAMGNYYFTPIGGSEVKVEYSFGYKMDKEGKLRINLHHSSMPYVPGLTREKVVAAQEAWGAGIVTIANTKRDGGNYEKAAKAHIENLYYYGQGTVLFKPTLTAEQQFRASFEGALSYFVAGDDREHKEDAGFAIKDWTNVRFENEEIIIAGNHAMAMGNYFFANSAKEETKVEYSFGYILDADGMVKINLHHSSLPYVPPPAPTPAP